MGRDIRNERNCQQCSRQDDEGFQTTKFYECFHGDEGNKVVMIGRNEFCGP